MRRFVFLVLSACGASEPTPPSLASSPPTSLPTTASALTTSTSTSEPPAAPPSASAPIASAAPPAEALPPPDTFIAKAALVSTSDLLGKTYVTLYERPFTCSTRGRDLEAVGTRRFQVRLEWKKGWKWTVDPKSPIHPAEFEVFTKNDAFEGARPSMSGRFPTEGELEVLSASPKRGRVRVRLVTIDAVVDTTIDALVCD